MYQSLLPRPLVSCVVVVVVVVVVVGVVDDDDDDDDDVTVVIFFCRVCAPGLSPVQRVLPRLI
jgi:uncharacterized protein YggT (Ycf19 family)